MLNFGNKEFRNLQEQVLKNAQDIETLKGRENLQIVIVEELPEVGNPNYIYLVPNNNEEEANIYDEYIWLADSEEYEKIGGVNIDLTSYVTLNTTQTITGKKTFTDDVIVSKITTSAGNLILSSVTGEIVCECFFKPSANNALDLGTSALNWKDLYLSGKITIKDNAATPHEWLISHLNDYYFGFGLNGNLLIYFNPAGVLFTRSLEPLSNNIFTLGAVGKIYSTTYTGNISDGANTVSVANIASKVTSTFISGTFDANGETTIDTEQAGTPEGLFIFTYGNCQCFLRLTAAMVQNADTVPIRISCPMIYNGATSLGWLNITKAGYILVLTITDGTNHVDSGYAWTLTKTNLL